MAHNYLVIILIYAQERLKKRAEKNKPKML